MSTSHTTGQALPSMQSRSTQGRALSKTRRFNGMERSCRSWDGVRKDHDLWQEDADCPVHFYTKGSSQRGPSLKVPFAAVRKSQSSYLLRQCLVTPQHVAPSTTSQTSDSGYDSAESLELSTEPKTYELYVPAPTRLSREQTYTYHVTTRNYFAFLTGQALVGDKLGLALADLWERANLWQQSEHTQTNLLNYCENQGYFNLAENPNYATAVLNLADRARLRDVWIHAFAHCVGMYDRLDSMSEYGALKNTTKALITRASLEMDLHIERVTRAVGNFLEDELGPERLGLTKPARDHLDHFRSFLHAYYVDQLGYFPPDNSELFDKRLWMNMYHDFRSLYEYLADTESDGNISNNYSAMNGGVCVLQNVQAFDRLNGYEPLPHSLPLLPRCDSGTRSTDAQRTLRSFRLGRTDGAAERILPSKMALASATNDGPSGVKTRRVVQEYQRFERQKLEEKVSVAEARKVRWLLIYGVLQMLISITKAPRGVGGCDKASYPLCVLVDGCPPWEKERDTAKTPTETAEQASKQGTTPTPEEPETSIRPDCEANNAQDYFSLSRRESANTQDMTPAPLRVTVPLSRTASIKTSVGALQRSVAGSFSRRHSRRGSICTTSSKPASHREILVQGYGNGSATEEDARSEALRHLEGVPHSQTSTRDAFGEFDFGLNNVAEEPMLEDHQLDDMFGMDRLEEGIEPFLQDHQLDDAPTPRFSWMPHSDSVSGPVQEDCPASATSEISTSNSLRSSYNDECPTPNTDRSSFTYSEPSTANSSIDFGKSFSAFPSIEHLRRASYAKMDLHSNGSPSSMSLKSLNVGCYQPSGIPRQAISPAVSKYALQQWRDDSPDGSRSVTSSLYPTEAKQADEIEEEEVRGRQRLRSSDGFDFP